MRQSPRTALTRIALVATFLTAFTALAPSALAATPRARMYQVTNGSRLNNGVHRVALPGSFSLPRVHRPASQGTSAQAMLPYGPPGAVADRKLTIFRPTTSYVSSSACPGETVRRPSET